MTSFSSAAGGALGHRQVRSLYPGVYVTMTVEGSYQNLRRFIRDIETGRELWCGVLPASGKATPMSYRLASGEQYVVVTAGGGEVWGKGDHVVGFRLPR